MGYRWASPCITFALILIGWSVRIWVRQSINFPIVRSIYFPILECLWSGFCCGQERTFSSIFGIIHHAFENCKLSVSLPDQRATTAAMPLTIVVLSARTLIPTRNAMPHICEWLLGVPVVVVLISRTINNTYAVTRQYQFFKVSWINRVIFEGPLAS